MPIEIFSHHAHLIRRAAAEAHPEECCGLLLGQGDRILDVIPSPNVAPDPSRFFEIDPAILLTTHRRARAEGLSLLGSYHSHPLGSLIPSLRDAAEAAEIMPLWILASSSQLVAWKWRAATNFTYIDLVELP